MTNTTQIPASDNQAWGFYGTMDEHAEAAWPIAMTAISDTTCQPLESVRLFLDSRHGRHFADDVQNGLFAGANLKDGFGFDGGVISPMRRSPLADCAQSR